MPAFIFDCVDRKCPGTVRLLRDNPPPRITMLKLVCPRCGGRVRRSAKGTRATVKEVIDTGLPNMPRRIERAVDVMELNHERAHQDHRRPDWQQSKDDKP